MMNLFATPIEETRAYQSIFAKGLQTGKAEGKAETLKRQLFHRFGCYPIGPSSGLRAQLLTNLINGLMKFLMQRHLRI
jgi:predicted transposase YdaD